MMNVVFGLDSGKVPAAKAACQVASGSPAFRRGAGCGNLPIKESPAT